jgi:hypothetical protein
MDPRSFIPGHTVGKKKKRAFTRNRTTAHAVLSEYGVQVPEGSENILQSVIPEEEDTLTVLTHSEMVILQSMSDKLAQKPSSWWRKFFDMFRKDQIDKKTAIEYNNIIKKISR